MKKFAFALSLLCLILVSCGENFKNMSGLAFGMTEFQAKSVIQRDNKSIVTNKTFFTCDKVKYLDFDWSYLRADFIENHLAKVRYCISNVDTLSSNSFDALKKRLVEHYPNLSTQEDTQNKFVLGDSSQTITLQINYSFELTYVEIPTDEEISRRNSIAREREDEINEKLQRLNEAMANYVKCLNSDPYNLREHYVNEVISLNNYLESHQDEMTPRQKEWFKKLQNVTL